MPDRGLRRQRQPSSRIHSFLSCFVVPLALFFFLRGAKGTFVEKRPQVRQPVAGVRWAALLEALFIFKAIGPSLIIECSDDLGACINRNTIR